MAKNSKSTQFSLVCFLLLFVSACGFTLRGSQALPEQLNKVVIVAPADYSPLSRALAKRLPVYQLQGQVNPISIAQSEVSSTVVITLQPERLERRLLSVFSSGQVAEYEIVYLVNYSVTFPGQDKLNSEVMVTREYQDDPDQVLAKSRELDLILDELRAESADKIIRNLSTQYSVSKHAMQDNKKVN